MCESVLERLQVEALALKRAQYEAFSFEVEPGRVTVRNGSYAEPREHEYSVRVVDGVPVECTCPADEYQSGACKHRLAVAIRSPVREAAVSDELMPDGGRPEATASKSTKSRDGESPDNCSCAGFPVGVPCWPCFRDGVKSFEE